MSKKDNRILNQECGRYPFKVSDEYFDNLTARIMAQIPEESAGKETKVIKLEVKLNVIRFENGDCNDRK